MMTFEEKWKNRMTEVDNENIYLSRSSDSNWLQKHVRWSFNSVNHLKACDAVLNNFNATAKNYFSFAAMVAEYCFLEYDNIWPYWDMKPYTYALLSDNKALIDRYAHLPVDEHIIYENPKDGRPAYWNYTIKGLLLNDKSIAQKGLDALDQQMQKKHEISISKAHMMCTEAIFNQDNGLLSNGLGEFEKTRNKSRFIKNDICEEVLSFFPLAYAKIAWMKGMEIDPGSKYMPIELLKIDPLPEYTIPYWFLRDWYREQGVDWRYDPVYPELQDWDKDPENPKSGGLFQKLFGK